ncbi:hypothetical protein RND81_01G222300 [Saponaria officinalis]|uniref:Thioredoxin domain-containing protein n=1 Tax=Saponaria officinalis TaxID=3572 RepID=A0AAW1NK48_SAPOF
MAEEGQVIACHSNEQWTLNLDKGKKENKLVVIDFTASWCGPCRVIAPILAECAKKYPNILFLKVDVDELKDVAEAWKIQAMPTFIFVKDDAKMGLDDSSFLGESFSLRGAISSTFKDLFSLREGEADSMIAFAAAAMDATEILRGLVGILAARKLAAAALTIAFLIIPLVMMPADSVLACSAS